jgi:aminoglycoside phosphotransferase (APT) family kinase protein
MEILLTGDTLSATAALEAGSSAASCPTGRRWPRRAGSPSRIARNGPLAVQAIKRSVMETEGLPEDEALKIELEIGLSVFGSEDAKRGAARLRREARARLQGPLSLLVDVERLDDWLGDRLPGAGARLHARRMSEGASNEIFLITRGPYQWVLRRPPAGHHDPDFANWIVGREAQVCAALDGTSVPHPTVVAACDDREVIGASFYLMEVIDGFTPKAPLPEPYASDPAARHALGIELIDALADLANVDWRAQGLGGFGKPDGFLERQVGRWLGQLAGYQDRAIPGLEQVASWLEANRPAMQRAALMHGDYQLINTMFRHGAPARMAAIIDWEQSTIGDPLLDLGWLLFAWSNSDASGATTGYFSPRAGLPSKEEMIARYAEATGLETGPLPYYEVLARFKLACVLEGSYQRFLNGRSDNPAHEQMGPIVLTLIAEAREEIAG